MFVLFMYCDIVRGYLKPSHYGEYFFTNQTLLKFHKPCVADYCILKGRLCLLCMAMFLFIWRDHAGLCTAKQARYSARFRHSSSLGWVCLFAARGGGGEGYVRVLKFQPLLCLYSIGFETDGDLTDGNLFSVVFCLLSP